MYIFSFRKTDFMFPDYSRLSLTLIIYIRGIQDKREKRHHSMFVLQWFRCRKIHVGDPIASCSTMDWVKIEFKELVHL